MLFAVFTFTQPTITMNDTSGNADQTTNATIHDLYSKHKHSDLHQPIPFMPPQRPSVLVVVSLPQQPPPPPLLPPPQPATMSLQVNAFFTYCSHVAREIFFEGYEKKKHLLSLLYVEIRNRYR